MTKLPYRRASLALIATLLATAPMTARADTVPGTQSAGTFELLVRVEPPVAPGVTIIGLDDIYLGTIQRQPGLEILDFNGTDDFCINTGWDGSVGSYPGPVTLTIFQVGEVGPNGRLALRGRTDPSKVLPISIQILGGRIGAESRPNGYVSSSGEQVSVAPSFASCTAASTDLTFNAAKIWIYSDPVVADSDLADGSLSGTFSIIVHAPS